MTREQTQAAKTKPQSEAVESGRAFDIAGLVFPIVAVRVDKATRTVLVDRFIGSGFWINSEGAFLTCRHVFESLEDGQSPALGNPFGEQRDSYTPVLAHRIHKDLDFGIGFTPVEKTRFLPPFAGGMLLPGQAVSAFGFTEWGKDEVKKSLQLDVRYLKGHLTRTSVEQQNSQSPQIVEVSFGSPSGFSGTPLLADSKVVGMLYGNVETKLQSYSLLEVKDGPTEYREAAYRIYEYGLAHHLDDLVKFMRDCGLQPFE
jgi:hypothetical protein